MSVICQNNSYVINSIASNKPLSNKELGRLGEQAAATYLSNHGYTILSQNYTHRWAELDIVAQKQEKLIFVEVKARTQTRYGQPHEAITYHKLLHLKRSIQLYLLQNPHPEFKLQIDVISIMLSTDGMVESLKHYEQVS